MDFNGSPLRKHANFNERNSKLNHLTLTSFEGRPGCEGHFFDFLKYNTNNFQKNNKFFVLNINENIQMNGL